MEFFDVGIDSKSSESGEICEQVPEIWQGNFDWCTLTNANRNTKI